MKSSTFKVHKAILASRSEVFKVMLDSDFKETEANEVLLINDIEEDVMEAILEYIYAGVCPELQYLDTATLLAVVHKYELRLQILLSRFIGIPTKENAIETLLDAHLYADSKSELMELIMDFINTDQEIAVSRNTSWEALKKERPDLVVLLYERHSKFYSFY